MKQIGSGILKRGFFIKFLFLFLVFAFSIDGFACDDVTGTVDGPSNPNDPASNYTAGYIMYCSGKERCLGYIEKASDMDHVIASYFLGQHYRRDREFNSSNSLPTIQENYDAAIFYYERAATLIENISNYPYGTHVDIPDVEENSYMSVRAFLHLSRLYYNGYIRAIKDMLSNDVSYTDTIKVLENMKNTADRCLKRPSLPVWGARQDEIAHSKQIICQAQKDFAEQALELEFRRIEIAKHCEGSLDECAEHQTVVQSLQKASREMGSRSKSVPKI
ncbi:MAG: hypothetical protein J4F48_09880 [Nitrospinae bacterium]|nr:hypothetical protein [Nitrospinota bacterium]